MALFGPPAGRRIRINILDDLDSFLASWDDPLHPANSRPCAPRKTQYGNITRSGKIDYEGDALSRWHPLFEESIEPGVRALVQLFALEFGWITYTSCEGHIYAKTGLLPVERHVGIAPRNEHERTQIISTLVSLRRAMSLKTLVGPVEISVIPSRLESPARTLSVVDFCFLRRRWRSWRAYFCALEPIYDGALQKLHEVSRRGRDGDHDTA